LSADKTDDVLDPLLAHHLETTDDVPEVLEDLPDLEALPPKPLPNIFRCPKGHVQLGPNETKVINRWNRQVDLTSGPVCLACYLGWMGKAFKTKDTGVQAEVKIEPEPS
jgi:hypothetical protein